MVERLQAGNGGGGARINTLGAPVVAKQRKPGDPLQVEAEPVVPLLLKASKTIQILKATRSMLRRIFFFVIYHRRKHRSLRVLFTWIQYLIVFSSNGAGVPDFGFAPKKRFSLYMETPAPS